MKIYNSATKKNIEIDLQNTKNISMYVCGPTVYNHVHIGNIRPIITFDVFHRYFKFNNINVNFVHNITDIDDKIINEAIKTNNSEKTISEKFYNAYVKIIKALNILEVTMPKVSDNINGIIDYINKIYQKGFAYKANDDIYFNVQKIDNYGSVSNMVINKLKKGQRIKKDESLQANDFVLWKKTNLGITWDSVFGKGRPGWHSECSFLINKHIGQQVDIHGGGIDLRFPHHENENAQNLALYEKDLAKIWVYVGHLLVDDEKMAKSLNNFVFAKDLLAKYDANSIRWMFYQTRYDKPFNYSKTIIEQCQKQIAKIELQLNKAKSYLIINKITQNKPTISQEFIEEINNNFNFPNIVTLLIKKIKMLSQFINRKQIDLLFQYYNELINELNIMGINFPNIHSDENIQLLKKWNEYNINQDYANSDKIRDILKNKKLI